MFERMIVDKVMGKYKKKIEDLKSQWEMTNFKNDRSSSNFHSNKVLEIAWNEEQFKLARKFQKDEKLLDAINDKEQKKLEILNKIIDKDQRKYKLIESISQIKKRNIEEKQKKFLGKLEKVKEREKMYFNKLKNEEIQMTKRFKQLYIIH